MDFNEVVGLNVKETVRVLNIQRNKDFEAHDPHAVKGIAAIANDSKILLDRMSIADLAKFEIEILAHRAQRSVGLEFDRALRKIYTFDNPILLKGHISKSLSSYLQDHELKDQPVVKELANKYPFPINYGIHIGG